MNEREVLARYGELRLKHEDLDANYSTLLRLLAGVVGGKIEPSRLLVNLTDRTWTLAPPHTRPATPATINGLPEVVVAPDPPPDEAAREQPD